METNEMTPEQSLQVISDAIANAEEILKRTPVLL